MSSPKRGRPKIYQTEEEWKQHLKEYRKQWYAKNKKHVSEGNGKVDDHYLMSIKERNKQYYHSTIKPAIEMYRKLQAQGIHISVQ